MDFFYTNDAKILINPTWIFQNYPKNILFFTFPIPDGLKKLKKNTKINPNGFFLYKRR